MSIADTKKSHSSILKTPINRVISKNVSSRTQISQIHPADELELSQDCRLMKANKKKKSDSDCPEGYPFVEEPVRFHFHDDYGTPQFQELRNAVLYESQNKQVPVGFCEPAIASREMKYSDDEIYNLSSEKDLIDSFLKENLL